MKGIDERWRPALRLILMAAAIVAAVTACQPALEPPEGQEEAGTYVDLIVGLPGASAPRLIQVTEYPVTSLLIEVSGPDGEVIQSIIWTPEQGSRRYRIPIKQLGEHEVVVVHRSRTEAGDVEAVESETFQIAPMIITEVKIIPGAVGYIIVDGEQRAADLQAREILPAILKQAEAEQYVVTRMATQLPSGTLISEDSPGTAGQRAEPLVLKEPSYLYYVDLQPGAFYEHPVRYLVVGRSGETRVIDAAWWPMVDNAVPRVFLQTAPRLSAILQRNVELAPSSVRIMDFLVDRGLVQLLTREAFICVQGLTPSESLYSDAVTTYQNTYNFFDAYRSSLSTLVGLTDYSADDVLARIDTLAEGGYDIITIYIIAHGGVDSVRLGGLSMTAGQFAAKMTSHPSIQFNFLLGSCHGGSFQDNLQALANVRVVETACTSAESAWPDKDNIGGTLDTNSADSGSEWTSSLLAAAQVLTSDAALWSAIVSRSNTYKVPRTSVLLNEAGYLGSGANRGLPTPLINYDLTDVVGWSTPQHYNSWEVIP